MGAIPARTVCITGCSTGFGRATALHLSQRGWRVFATVRKTDDQKQLTKEGNDCIVPVICDITNEHDVAKLQRIVSGLCGGGLDALVNNAGTVYAAPLELLTPKELMEQLDVNTVAQLAVTQALMPMLKAGRGKIVNVSSIYGRIAQPIFGAYCASKFALEALSDSLRIELAPFGMHVVVVEPYVSPTAAQETTLKRARSLLSRAASRDYDALIESVHAVYTKQLAHGFSPALFAATVERILNDPRPRARYVIPKRAAGLIWLRRLLPDILWDRLVRRTLNW